MKRQKFIKNIQSGLNQTQAAIAAGYSEATAKQAGSRLMRHPAVKAALYGIPINQPKKTRPAKSSTGSGKQKVFADPLKFLELVMNDESQDPRLRVDAAKTMLPYVHARKGEKGKKELQLKDAEKITNKFASIAPPNLKAVR